MFLLSRRTLRLRPVAEVLPTGKESTESLCHLRGMGEVTPRVAVLAASTVLTVLDVAADLRASLLLYSTTKTSESWPGVRRQTGDHRHLQSM